MDEFEKITKEGVEAFHQHIINNAMEARLRYGLYIDTKTIMKMLDDRKVVRYPTAVVFEATPLEGDSFAYAQPNGENPNQGFILYVHPFYKELYEVLPLLISYHIPAINYSHVATSTEAELFGATLMGLEVEAYYQAICELADARFKQ